MKSFKDVFQTVKNTIKSNISETAANLWVEPLEFIKYEDNIVTINCGESFVKNIVIENKYAELWKKGFEETLGFPVKINFLDNEEAFSEQEEENGENSSYQIVNGDEEKETFDNFVVGPSNKFAHAAALAVTMNPGGINNKNGMNYNPLFIYGDSGLGKTHLLRAIANEIKKRYPEMKIIFVHTEEFTNEFIYHLGNKTTSVFHDKYRKADVLIFDDVQFLSGRTQTQEEFFHTMNSIVSAGKQIVLSSDRPPREIETLANRIRNRLEGGLLADIQPPELETRIAIIKNKAEKYDLELNDDYIIEYIAERVKNDIRQLEGVVKKLKAFSTLNIPINISVVQNVIKDIITNNRPIPQTTEKIILEVSRIYNIPIDDIYSKKRNASISNARQICMYIIRNVTGLTFEEIGKKFDKNHATVMHAIYQVEDKIKHDSTLKAQISDIIKNVKNI